MAELLKAEGYITAKLIALPTSLGSRHAHGSFRPATKRQVFGHVPETCLFRSEAARASPEVLMMLRQQLYRKEARTCHQTTEHPNQSALPYDTYGDPSNPTLLLLHGAAATDTFCHQYAFQDR